MRFARRLARFNKVVTNRAQMLWAPRVAPWAVVVHVGRRTGREYRTPVVAFVSGSSVTIALFYGTDSDWVRNLLAAGGGTFVRSGRERRLTDPEVVPAAEADVARYALPIVRRASHVLVARLV